MAHVAEASEANGRVLYLLETGACESAHSAGAAVRLAAAFNAEIEAVALNADAVARARLLPVTSLASTGGPPDVDALERAEAQSRIMIARQMKILTEAARRAGVPSSQTSVSGDAVDQIDALCLARGPWNVVVLSGPVCEQTARIANSIFASVSGATGIVTAAPRCPHPDGPIAIVAEDADRLPAMLRAAGRLKGLCGRVHLLLAADRRKDLNDLDTHVRLATGNHKGLVIEPPFPMLGIAGALDDTLRNLKPSFVIARFAGSLLPSPQVLARTVAVASAPFLLVR
jgi:hypothetical protein